MTAVSACKYENVKVSRATRFLYTTPPFISSATEIWVGMHCSNNHDWMILISSHGSKHHREQGRLDMENRQRQKCSVPTLAQRCAGSFLFCQLRVTGTIAGSTLLSYPRISSLSGIFPSMATPLTPSQSLQKLEASWFSTTRATELMKQRSAKKFSVSSFLSSQSCVKSLFECIMLCHEDHPWLVCFPNEIS